jgi:hypothetical protein
MLFILRDIICLLFEVFRYCFFLICNMNHHFIKEKELIKKQCKKLFEGKPFLSRLVTRTKEYNI